MKHYNVHDPTYNASELVITVNDVTSTTLFNLYPGSIYTIFISALNSAGEGYKSELLTVNTDASGILIFLYLHIPTVTFFIDAQYSTTFNTTNFNFPSFN